MELDHRAKLVSQLAHAILYAIQHGARCIRVHRVKTTPANIAAGLLLHEPVRSWVCERHNLIRHNAPAGRRGTSPQTPIHHDRDSHSSSYLEARPITVSTQT